MSDVVAATPGASEGDLNLRFGKVGPEKPEPAPEPSTSRAGSGFGDFFQNILSYWYRADPLANYTAISPLVVWKRVLAGGFGSLTIQSAIAISYIPYPPPVIKFNNFGGLSEATIPAVIVLYWILISCVLFSGYNRRADFVHVFRASLIFNLFIVAVASVGHLGAIARFQF